MSSTVAPRRSVSTLESRTAPGWGASVGAVIRRGLRDRRRATLAWGLSLGAYGGFMAAVYPSIHEAIDQVVKNYPSALKQAFDVASMSTVEGYLQAELFSLLIPLAIGYFVIRGVTEATVGPESRGYLDTILSLPVARAALMAGSCVVAALTALVVMLITGAVTFAAGRIAGTHISPGLVTAGVLGVWPLGLFAGGIAAAASGAMHSGRAASGLAMGILVGMYALDLAGKLADGLEPLRWLSAFRYYASPMRDGIDPVSFAGLTLVAGALMAAGAILFERRDVLH